MALTHRGKVVIGVGAAGLIVLLGILAFTGNAPGPIQDVVDAVVDRPDPCPLTGELRPGDEDAPERPAFAVKIENTDAAYPLAGLAQADIVYEEPVEGGITRFMALYQCRTVTRAGPVRSARTTDPKILVQYGDAPLMAYSGAAGPVTELVDRTGIESFTETSAPEAFTRDDARVMPHDLFVSVRTLYREAKKVDVDRARPEQVFTFGDDLPSPNRRAREASITFSSSNVAEWTWSDGRWARILDGAPMALEDGESVAADNVLIQEVVVTEGTIVDASGAKSPEVDLTGRGRAWLLRDGRRIVGRWQRDSLDDPTVFETKAGEAFVLAPGTTWVELVPKDAGAVSFG